MLLCYICVHADTAAINFLLTEFQGFHCIYAYFLHIYILVLLEYMYWILGSIYFVICGVLS